MTSRIAVIGIYRSGTSLCTKLVQEWGAYAGKSEELFSDEYGYLEHVDLQKLNDDLVENNSNVPQPAEKLIEKARRPEYREKALEILDKMDQECKSAGAPAWVWKDPRLPLVIPFWSEIWGVDIAYVVPVRHPVETIQSAAKMEGLDPDAVPLSAGLAYWQFCMLNVLQYTQAAPKKFFIGYDQLIQNPDQQTKKLADFLNQLLDPLKEPDETVIKKMAQIVSRKQHHQIASKPLLEFDVVERKQNALYNFLRLKTIYPDEPFLLDDFSLHPAWHEYLKMMDTLVNVLKMQRSD